MIIALSAGVAFVNCQCRDAAAMAETSGGQCCCCRQQAPAKAMQKCMEVKVVKLNPFDLAQQISIHFQQLPAVAPFAGFMGGSLLPPDMLTAEADGWEAEPFTSPPRSYLSMLRILRL